MNNFSLCKLNYKTFRAHNPEVACSNPAPATMKTRLLAGFFVYLGRAHNLIGTVMILSGVFVCGMICRFILNNDGTREV